MWTRFYLVVVAFSVVAPAIASAIASADSVWPGAVRRRTADRSADLLRELLRRQQYDDAEAYCRFHLKQSDGRSDEAARWSIRLSQTLSARQLSASTYDADAMTAAQQPVRDLRDRYPQHPRALFLEAQVVGILRDAAGHEIVRASVSPTGEQRIDQAMKLFSRAINQTQELSQRTADARTQLGSLPDQRDPALLSDLLRLQQRLVVDAVSLAVLQTELFRSGSQDLLAAATHAESAAEQALLKLPASSAARREVERLRIESMVRGSQFERAESAWRTFTTALPKPLSPRIVALEVRIDLGRNQLRAAKDKLQRFYGSTPDEATPSIEMDLARLHYLLADDDAAGQVGPWLDAIEKRNGLYVRRRAEAFSLARLRSDDRPKNIDASLVAAQAADWIRRGELEQGGKLFAAAAAVETDPARALRHAVNAAAALAKANRTTAAAEILTRTAITHPSPKQAPVAHLQAAVLIASKKTAESAKRVEALLEQHLQRWPAGEQAPAARKWLISLLTATQRHAQAAEIATKLPASQVSPAALAEATRLWRNAVLRAEADQVDEVLAHYRSSFQSLAAMPVGRGPFRSAATYLLDRDELAELPERDGEPSVATDLYCERLLEFRRASDSAAISLPAPPPELSKIVDWRLMRDGRTQPSRRGSIAQTLHSWSPGSASLAAAERLLWRGQALEATKMLRAIAKESDNAATVLRQGALLLGRSQAAGASAEAIKIWDELAAGLPQGSSGWHDAKLNAIQLLRRRGKREEAKRRAEYVLLTSPPDDVTLQRQYRATVGTK